MLEQCVICDEVRGIGTPIAYEDEAVVVFPARWQPVGNPGYALLVTKEHVRNLYELDDVLAGPLMQRLRDVAIAVEQSSGADGTTIRQNNNPPGQEINHIHFHVVPRFMNDGYWDAVPVELDPLVREAQAEALGNALRDGQPRPPST